MNRFEIIRRTGLGALAMCAVLGMTSRTAAASARVEIGVGVGGGYYPAPVYTAPVYSTPVYTTAPVCEGHYETRVERVLVAPERRDRRWVEPVYETRFVNGYQQSFCVRQGGWQEYCVPAQYENRSTRVWVGGCASSYYAPSYTTYYSPYYATPRYVAPSYGLDFTYRSRH